MEEQIAQLLSSHIEQTISLADQFPEQLIELGSRLAQCLLADGKIIVCAHGRAYPNGLHFANAMLHRFAVERPALPVTLLGTHLSISHALVSEGHSDQLFAREIQALGQENDVLLILSTTCGAPALVQAVHAAKEKGMDTLVIAGEEGGVLAHHLAQSDLALRLPSRSPTRIVALQLLALHAACSIIESTLFGHSTE